MNQLGLKKQIDASLIVQSAQELIEKKFGQRGTENLRAVSFRNGTLKVGAANNVWAAECQSQINFVELEKVEQTRFVIMTIT